jgi:hypothetical protein
MKRIVLKRTSDGVLFGLIPELEKMAGFERFAIEVPAKGEAPKTTGEKKTNTKPKKPVKIEDAPVVTDSATDLDDIISGLE